MVENTNDTQIVAMAYLNQTNGGQIVYICMSLMIKKKFHPSKIYISNVDEGGANALITPPPSNMPLKYKGIQEEILT